MHFHNKAPADIGGCTGYEPEIAAMALARPLDVAEVEEAYAKEQSLTASLDDGLRNSLKTVLQLLSLLTRSPDVIT